MVSYCSFFSCCCGYAASAKKGATRCLQVLILPHFHRLKERLGSLPIMVNGLSHNVGQLGRPFQRYPSYHPPYPCICRPYTMIWSHQSLVIETKVPFSYQGLLVHLMRQLESCPCRRSSEIKLLCTLPRVQRTPLQITSHIIRSLLTTRMSCNGQLPGIYHKQISMRFLGGFKRLFGTKWSKMEQTRECLVA